MTQIIPLIRWLLKSWPIFVPIIFGVIHYLIIINFKVNTLELNKIISLVFQIIGGILVIYSIDSNIGIVNNLSLIEIIKRWLFSIPLFSNNIRIQVNSENLKVTAYPAKIRVGGPTETIEDKIKYIQKQIDWLKDDLEDEIKHLKRLINSSENRVNKKLSEINGKIGVIDTKVSDVSTGGIKIQVFGILLMVYGSFSSYYA